MQSTVILARGIDRRPFCSVLHPFFTQHVCSVAANVGRAAGDAHAEVVLGDDFHGEVVFLDLNVGTGPDGRHESALYLGSGIVGMVQNAELRVTALAVQVEGAVVLAVEVDAPLHQLLYLFGCVSYYLLHGGTVRDEVAGYHGVFNVLLEIVELQVGDAGHSALRERCVRLVEAGFADEAHLAFLGACHFQGVAHSGYTGSYNQEIVLIYHISLFWFAKI